jgi:uncharacterized membrane protein YbhN (UPF0104 family)
MRSSAALPAPAPPGRERLKRGLSLLFIALMLGLVAWAARGMPWGEVAEVLADYRPGVLAAAGAVAALSHLIYSSYDLLGRAWTGHSLPAYRVMQTTFISYAFNLNLGTLVGGVAFRFRLYTRLGLDKEQIGRVLALSLATNWLGYALLAGGVFALGLVSPPADWALSAAALRGLGGLLWLVVAVYLVLCTRWQGRSFSLRGHRFTLPGWRMALLQLALSSANWLVMAAVLYLLFLQQVPYAQLLAVLLVAAVAGALAHVPAGLGVLEAVFIALLAGPQLAQASVLAALLAYRALYYLLPLAVAALLYLLIETRAARIAPE